MEKSTNTNVRSIALKDIAHYMKSQNIKIVDGNHDVWAVTANHLDNKETRHLNRLLGIGSINKYGNTNGLKIKDNKDTNK